MLFSEHIYNNTWKQNRERIQKEGWQQRYVQQQQQQQLESFIESNCVSNTKEVHAKSIGIRTKHNTTQQIQM